MHKEHANHDQDCRDSADGQAWPGPQVREPRYGRHEGRRHRLRLHGGQVTARALHNLLQQIGAAAPEVGGRDRSRRIHHRSSLRLPNRYQLGNRPKPLTFELNDLAAPSSLLPAFCPTSVHDADAPACLFFLSSVKATIRSLSYPQFVSIR